MPHGKSSLTPPGAVVCIFVTFQVDGLCVDGLVINNTDLRQDPPLQQQLPPVLMMWQGDDVYCTPISYVCIAHLNRYYTIGVPGF